MKIINEFLWGIFNEALYHGSPVQNLKVIKPTFKTIKGKVSFCTPRIDYAACFCIPNYKTKRIIARVEAESYKVIIPQKEKNDLLVPCSIYRIECNNLKEDKSQSEHRGIFPQYLTFENCKVIEEIKFKSVKQCYNENEIKYIIK